MLNVNLLFLFLLAGAPGVSGDSPDAPTEEWRLHLTEGLDLLVGPKVSLFPPYVASQYRPTFAIKSVHNSDSDIVNAGDKRFGLRVGGRFTLFQFVPKGGGGQGVQIDAEVGILAQFDRNNSTDNLGWDGIYGMHASWMATPDLGLRVGFAHDSSHVGDEFIESTGRMRIEYTREELNAGASLRIGDRWRAYIEYGHAYDLRNEELMEEGRVEFGLEFESRKSPWGGRSKPYAALDVNSFEEDHWAGNITFQLGIKAEFTSGTIWRFAAELYDGRSPIGEFFQEEESHLAWGLWLDV